MESALARTVVVAMVALRAFTLPRVFMDCSLKAFLDIGLAFFGISGSSATGFFVTAFLIGDFFAFDVFTDTRVARTGFLTGLAARVVGIAG